MAIILYKLTTGSIPNFGKICASNSWKYPLVALLRIIVVEESNGDTVSGGRTDFQYLMGKGLCSRPGM
jgi:hypothetical protein